MLEPLASAMEQPPNLRDEWGSFAGSMIWLRVNALRQMVTVMIKSFDFSDPMGWTDASKKIALLSAPLNQRDQCKSRPQDLRLRMRKEISQNIRKCHASKALNAINTTR